MDPPAPSGGDQAVRCKFSISQFPPVRSPPAASKPHFQRHLASCTPVGRLPDPPKTYEKWRFPAPDPKTSRKNAQVSKQEVHFAPSEAHFPASETNFSANPASVPASLGHFLVSRAHFPTSRGHFAASRAHSRASLSHVDACKGGGLAARALAPIDIVGSNRMALQNWTGKGS